MKRTVLLHFFVSIILAVSLIFNGVSFAQNAARNKTVIETTNTETAETDNQATEPIKKPESISVAVYPYVSNMELFQEILTDMWEEIEPDISLNYVNWDCYGDPYPNNIDVITYDALFLSSLVENDYVQPLNTEAIDNTYGILSFAMDGAHENGTLYGLPFLACTSLLIHRADDEAMSQVTNYGELCKELAARKKLDPNDGLQSGYYVDAPYLYLDALADYNSAYSTYEEGLSMETPDEVIVSRLHEIRDVLAPIVENESFRERFGQGEGSACTDYSEALYFMGDAATEMTVRPISFFEGENIQMFFTDLASVCSHVTDPAKLECCMKLINLMASEEFQYELCFGTGDIQYMLPAREQVYVAAKEKYPIYETLYELATDKNNRVYRFGPTIYDYIRDAGIALS